MNKLEQPILLWVDLLTGKDELLLSDHFSRYCQVQRPGDKGLVDGVSSHINLICFEYDFPDCDSLCFLKETKQRYSHIPIVMITQQHSEDLAIWALRNGVFDYLYKPLNEQQIYDACYSWQLFLAKLKSGPSSHEPLSLASSYPDEVRFKQSDSVHSQMELAKSFLEANYNRVVNETEVADLLGMTRFKFARLFKSYTGKSYKDYLCAIRIRQAVNLLQNPSASVSDVCFAVGFNDPSYFTRVFKRETGQLPSGYRGIAGKLLPVPDVFSADKPLRLSDS